MRRSASSAAAVLAAIVLAACASDADDPATSPTTTPPVDDASTEAGAIDTDDSGTDAAEPEEPGGDDTNDEGSDAGAADADPADASATDATLAPDASADLPTVRPDEVAPVTTTPGPLPTPTVQLIEEASYDQPVDATVRADDLRMIVVEKGGRVVGADAESSITLLDMADLSASADIDFTDSGGEQGLLGVAFHPDAPLGYVHFSGSDGDTVVAELAVDGDGVFDVATYRELLRIAQPFGNHNGGELEFGPDGLLYLALGDGGSADDPERSGLDLANPLGSILRFDPTPAADEPITIPADNPYAPGVTADGVEADPLIWSSGLRNPWKFSFDAITGDLWIADVGQGDFEEINRAAADADSGLGAGRGLDFGWSAFEAYEPFHDDQSSPAHTPPVAAYPHENGDCSVSGGVVARNSSYADLNGWYVYGDFCSGRLWALDTTSIPSEPGPDTQPTIVELAPESSVPSLTSVVVGPDGDVYALSLNGPVYRLAPA
ncbi:MAG: PQQ-dependent sugar dehydrogenase [Actinomycetota bacterium]